MADTSDLVKRARHAIENYAAFEKCHLAGIITHLANALESAPTMRIEVDDAMVERATEEWKDHYNSNDLALRRDGWVSLCVRAALTAALNPQPQGKNNG